MGSERWSTVGRNLRRNIRRHYNYGHRLRFRSVAYSARESSDESGANQP
jgi:hypothetical protein